MTVKGLMVTNGLINGAIIDDNGKEKKARIQDIQKLLELNKITAGARLVDGQIFYDDDVLNNIIYPSKLQFDGMNYTDDGKLKSGTVEGKEVTLQNLWSLAADGRLDGLEAAYDEKTDSKLVVMQ